MMGLFGIIDLVSIDQSRSHVMREGRKGVDLV